MGRRILELLDFIRFLRTTDPKYSFEVLLFNTVLGLACIAFSLLGEQRLWAISFAVLCFSLAIHSFRIRRVLKRRIQVKQDWLAQMTSQLEQALSDYERAAAAARHNEHDDNETAQALALLREDLERARERELDGAKAFVRCELKG